MKIVFFGTPGYTLPVLQAIHKEFKTKAGTSPVVAVVTRKPKKAGRKGYLKYSAIDDWAHKRNIPIYFDAEKLIKENVNASIGILAAYGEILPTEVIEHFPQGILNIHPSILPRWRGAAPVQATLVAGDKKAGVTIIKVDEKMDHGPIVSQFTEDIKSDDTTGSLRNRLFDRSAEVMTTLIPPYLDGKVNIKDQEHEKATHTTLVKKRHGFIPPEYLDACMQGKILQKDWEIEFIRDFSIKPMPQVMERFVRAMKPWPEAWSKIKIKNKELRIKILKAHLEKRDTKNAIRETKNSKTSPVLRITYLVPDEVQLEGKNPVSWKQFKEGYPQSRF